MTFKIYGIHQLYGNKNRWSFHSYIFYDGIFFRQVFLAIKNCYDRSMGIQADFELSSYRDFFDNFTSEHTRKSYINDIKQFIDYLTKYFSQIVEFSQIERSHLIDYRNYLGETGGRGGEPAAPKTIARKLAALSSFFDFLVEKGERSFNPVISVKRPRREVVRPTYALNVEQVRGLLASIDCSRPAGVLHKALLTMFFTTGMRKSEILGLRFKDYREINQHRVVEFKGKGGKIFQKLLHPMCIQALEDYIALMSAAGKKHGREDWLFQPTKNSSDSKNTAKPLNPKTVNEILDYYAKKIGLDFKATPHGARATFISELLNVGVDIYTVAQEVGHSSVKTTQEYDKRRRKLSEGPVSKLPY